MTVPAAFVSFLPSPLCQICSSESPAARWTCRQRNGEGKGSSGDADSGGAGRRARRTRATRGGQSSPGRGRGAKRHLLYSAMAAYAEHFAPLLATEAASEQAEYAAATKAPSLLQGVKAFRRPRVLGHAVYVLEKPGRGEKLGQECRMAKGDIVIVREQRYRRRRSPDTRNSTGSTSKTLGKSTENRRGESLGEDDNDVEASVMERDLFGVKVAVPIGSQSARTLQSYEEGGLLLSLEQGANILANERAVAAVTAATDKSANHSEPCLLVVRSFADASESIEAEAAASRGPTRQAISNASHNGKVGEATKWEEAARCSPPKLNKAAVADAVRDICQVRVPPNTSQRNAIRQALSRTVSIIHGPPGTGKTATAASIIVGAVLAGSGPVLATAASNVAVDNLMGKVLDVCREVRDLRVVRVGRVAAVAETLWDRTLEGMLERDRGVRRAREDSAGNLNGTKSAAAVYEAEQQASRRIIGGADVVFATCVTAGQGLVAQNSFRLILCDEATQATEPEALIPLTGGMGDLRQVVLVGDHHQLPPTVLSDADNPGGLVRSLFSRLWHAGVSSTMLDTQYRMHPDISSFPSRQFYFGKLKTAVTRHERALPASSSDASPLSARLLSLLGQRRVLFLNLASGKEEYETSPKHLATFSYCNHAEAELACAIVHNLPLRRQDIGLISPYSAQVRLLTQMLSRSEGDELVEVNSVDGFQGREKEAIVFSAVRSNTRGRVGFLADWRRLNVALTRSKSALIVVGSSETLHHDVHWAAWLRHAPTYEASELFPSLTVSPHIS